MPVVPGNALQQRIQKINYTLKQPALLSSNTVAVTIREVYDADRLNEDGVPEPLAPYLIREPGTLYARVKVNKTGKEFIVGFMASEAEIFSAHGNSVLLKGLQGTIIYTGFRPEEGRLVLRGESIRPLTGSDSTIVFDISGIS
jgi:hypothetical protein